MAISYINPLLPLTDFALERAEESRKESNLSGGEGGKYCLTVTSMDVIDSLSAASQSLRLMQHMRLTQ